MLLEFYCPFLENDNTKGDLSLDWYWMLDSNIHKLYHPLFVAFLQIKPTACAICVNMYVISIFNRSDFQ